MMPDREKVIKEKLDEMVELTRGLNYVAFMTAVENANDILELLKEQDKRINMKQRRIDQLCKQLTDLKHRFHEKTELVRCKDCKECYFASNRIQSEQTFACGKHGIDVTQDWFCADGERKSD